MHNLSPDKPLPQAGTDKVRGHGRANAGHEQVTSARVPNRRRSVARECKRGDMRTRLQAFCVASFISLAAFSQSPPPVPPELIGTWATAAIDCTRHGPTTLTINASSVLRFDAAGDITGTRIIGRRSVHVQFEYLGPDVRNLGARTFRLSSEGVALFELSQDRVVATRRKCNTKKT